MSSQVGLSAIIPVTERRDATESSRVEHIYHAYKKAIEATGITFEFIYVLDGAYPATQGVLKGLKDQGEPITIVLLSKWFGEATALTIGFEQAKGDIILTLPPFLQVAPAEIPQLVQALEGADMVVARRWPRYDSKFRVAQTKAFHGILRLLVNCPFNDLGCTVRVFRRHILQEIVLYGDQHRFLPLLAERYGFKVREVNAAQAHDNLERRTHSPGAYVRRMLDILAIYFLVKFTQKPLRFFGLVGVAVLSVGVLETLYVLFERFAFDKALADRPALILGTLMVVLGIQLVAVGLIGELIIFFNSSGVKHYKIDKIIQYTRK